MSNAGAIRAATISVAGTFQGAAAALLGRAGPASDAALRAAQDTAKNTGKIVDEVRDMHDDLTFT